MSKHNSDFEDDLYQDDTDSDNDLELDDYKPQNSRQRIEDLLEERKLRYELDDYDDYISQQDYSFNNDDEY